MDEVQPCALRTTGSIRPAMVGACLAQGMTGLTGGAITVNLSAQPRYIIEYLGVGTQPFRRQHQENPQGTTSRVGEHHIYRITARGPGGTDGVVRVTESYYWP